jgi:enoyl-CoA hydratase/carnithine racemase
MTDAPNVATAEVRDGIAWLNFNRPEKRNAMNPNLNRRMAELLDELEFDPAVRVLVLKGEGEAWSAGMDLKKYFRETEAQGIGATRAQEAANSFDNEGRMEGIRQFIDEKSYKPGLGTYDTTRKAK